MREMIYENKIMRYRRISSLDFITGTYIIDCYETNLFVSCTFQRLEFGLCS